ncbi:MAG TPA: SDR family oxidoreductase [Vicinamibacterales bacterium]
MWIAPGEKRWHGASPTTAMTHIAVAEAVRWARRGARINTISPGIIITPLAKDELTGPRGEGYRRMIELSPARRAGTPDEVGSVAALLMGPDGGFISGSDFLMEGGVTASYWFGDLARTRKHLTACKSSGLSSAG